MADTVGVVPIGGTVLRGGDTVTLSTSIFSTSDALVEYNPTANQGLSDCVNREFLMLPF